MAANREDVDRWIKTAKEGGYTFIVSVCDTFDWDDYPVYCKSEVDMLTQVYEHDGKNMQRVNEVIKIDGDTVIENYNYR